MNFTLTKRIGSFLMAIVLLFTMVPSVGFAAEVTGDDMEMESVSSDASNDASSEVVDEEDPESTETPAPITAVDVSSAAALEQALADQNAAIRIIADFQIDRTFYIAYNVMIFTEEVHTLTRAVDFAGDMFVVGEAADGIAATETVALTLGDPSAADDLLTIDGNSENMTVDVVGTVVYVSAAGEANLHRLTVTNCTKVGNERALAVTSGLSNSPANTGGAVGIVVQGGALNLYGGVYSNNSVTASDTSNGYGGAFYNHSTMNIYGAAFENNTASTRGGAIYNYRTLNIYNGEFYNNSTSGAGGAIYLPSSSGAILRLGGKNDMVESSVLFKGNSAGTNGGAICYSGTVAVSNTVFEQNTAANAGGALYGVGSYSNLTVDGASFLTNSAGTNGGAIWLGTQCTLSSVMVDLYAKNAIFTGNNAADLGGAIYMENSTRAYLAQTSFTGNSTAADSGANGGAIYVTASTLDVNHCTFNLNEAYYGGGIYMGSSAAVTMNDISADSNTASGNGGFLYNLGATLNVYHSTIQNNTASAGSAMYFYTSAVVNLYDSVFHNNTCLDTNTSNAGALFCYTGGTNILVHSCSFTNNISSGLGGALLVSGKTSLQLYNITATGNSASKGGFMYETTATTNVTLSGLTVSGNSASVGGPIIWGNTANAILNINKSNYADLEATGELDDAYWTAAIYNKLTVNEVDTEIPTYTEYDQPEYDPDYCSDVRTAQQLAGALANGYTSIRILNDLVIDRSFYVTASTTIYSDEAVTLTRAADFAGDIFVVGEAADGTACKETVTLTLGDPASSENGLLTIDGNSENMTVDVTGSVIFVCCGHRAELYSNLTVTNCTKVGNEKTLTEAYGVSYPRYVGGAVGIITANASMNIYGGIYSNNHGQSTGSSSYGGAFYNFGTVKVYGGLFENNTAYRAGAFYNYRKLYLYNAQLVNNHAYSAGGAIYLPASTGSFLYLGLENDLVESSVVFRGNSSDSIGGAISNSATVTMENTVFESNTANQGGALYSTASGTVKASGITFSGNAAAESGGALYMTGSMASVDGCVLTENSAVSGGGIYVTGQSSKADEEGEVELYVTDTDFAGNSATNGGAVYLTDTARAYFSNGAFASNAASSYGGAIYNTAAYLEIDLGSFTKNSAASGGGINLTESAAAIMNRITATENEADNQGGFLYSSDSTVELFNSTVQSNTAKNGGGLYLFTSTTGGIYNTLFEENTATASAGALFIYTDGSSVTVHTCTFKNNTGVSGGAMYTSKKSLVELYNITATGNSADKGGFLYETTSGTSVTISGLTVSGNNATSGGPLIWGNSAGAVLYLNKTNYTDSDVEGELDDAYWTNAIANSLSVYDSDASIPYYADYGNEDPGELRDSFDVSSADELEEALLAGQSPIRITADFLLDRTFYITSDTIIFSSSKRTLTRAADFGGDIFVVGEAADGTVCSESVTLTLGNPGSSTRNLLKLDGNEANMTTEVNGTVIFVCNGANAELHENLTVVNCSKTANEKTNTGSYGVSYPDAVGGAVAILTKNAAMTIYGGTYADNTACTSGSVSSYGGAFYNFGVLTIYGGTFQNNSALRGGAFYNYRTMYIYKATILDNTASLGGMVYVPASTAAFLYLGGENDVVESAVTISGNYASSTGGAIYNGATTSVRDTVFQQNTSKKQGGAIYNSSASNLTVCSSSFIENKSSTDGGALYLTTAMGSLENTDFQGNQAENGGAVYINGQSTEADQYELVASDVTFTGNTAELGGAVYLTGTARASVSNCEFGSNQAVNGGAVYAVSGTLDLYGTTFSGNSATGNGGGLALFDASTAVLRCCTAQGNSADLEGGFVYGDASALKLYDCSAASGSAASGGAVALHSQASAYICNTAFENNTASANGGALLVTSGSEAFTHSCSFTDNTAGESGGAVCASDSGILQMYHASAAGNSANYGGVTALSGEGTKAEINGLAVSGNSAVTAGSVIYGNAATLTVSKTNWTDSDLTGEPDDSYWESVICGELSITETSSKVPGYAEYGNEDAGELWEAVTVTTVDELEAALLAGEAAIRIAADLQLDRNLTVSSNTAIFTTKAYTLTRAEGFTGDLFTVNSGVTLTLGNPISETADLLVIDGNGGLVSASGTVICLLNGAEANLYSNLTVTSCVSVGNGAAMTVAQNSTLNIFGGSYNSNRAEYGGVLFSQGNVNISGGIFSENTAVSGGVIHAAGGNVQVSGADFQQNTATAGGVIALSDSAMAILSSMTAQNNAAENGGFAYVSGATLSMTECVLSGNTASECGGAIMLCSGASAELHSVTGSGHSAVTGGFLYAEEAALTLSSSNLSSNRATNGGAIALVNTVSANIQSTAFTGNTAKSNGGALWTDCSVLVDLSEFNSNKAVNGGAIYVSGSSVSLIGSTFTENSASYYGGAIALYDGASVLAKEISATANASGYMGGAIYSRASALNIYDSTFADQTAGRSGGVMALTEGSSLYVDSSSFSGNSTNVNGGVIYSSNSDSMLTDCTFSTNHAASYGGAAYLTGSSELELYNVGATGNTAFMGGVAYLTGSAEATVDGLTISNNSASAAGPVFYGTSGAVLNINPSTSQYSVVGTMTVNKISTSSPSTPESGSEIVDSSWTVVNVASAKQLQKALASGASYIRITADFTLDRTFYITYPVTIFSTEKHTLTRAKNFAGDIFVVGESSNGSSALLSDGWASLTLGNPLSDTEDLLIIDGNRSKLTVEVTGSVLFIAEGSVVNLYDNVTIRNNLKLGNDRILDSHYGISHAPRVGGSVALVASGTLNIYGGKYLNNAINEENAETNENSNSTYGGAIYNRAALFIYGGTFSDNEGARGGAIYNYCVAKIYGGTFSDNHATKYGGVYYAPSSAGVHVLIGSSAESGSQVLFKGNTAHYTGGAFYNGVLSGLNIYGNTTFSENKAQGGNGGAIYSSGQLMARNALFENNSATSYGGAIHTSNGTEAQITRYVELENCIFSGNRAKYGGAISQLRSSSNTKEGSIVFLTDCEFSGNSATSAGGVLHMNSKSTLTAENCTFHDNTSSGEAGVAYITGLSTASFTGCTFDGNSADSHGGVISIRSGYLTMNNITAAGNASSSNGGVIYIAYSSSYDMNSVVDITGSSFTGNFSKNGGVFYVTKRAITEEHPILTVRSSSFENNKAVSAGGAVRLTGGVDVYLYDVDFLTNSVSSSSGQGGAISAGNCVLEIDGATFTGNTSQELGGAISMESNASVTLNDITASGNQTAGNGGFLHSTEATLNIYKSSISKNSAANGGGMYLYYGAVSNLRSTKFTSNSADSTGAGLFIYTNGANVLLHSCTLTDNSAGSSGGGLYISGVSKAQLYSTKATGNSAAKGGFLYETKAGTEVLIAGLTVSGNTASDGGSIIWGNTTNAILNINKSLYSDSDHSGTLNDAYWSEAIFNLLTVNNVSTTIPSNVTYTARKQSEESQAGKNPVVSVKDVLSLGLHSSDADINDRYSKFSKLDNSSNFMSRGTTYFKNINGGTVSVDTFVYQNSKATDNMQVGLGLLIYQAILYKQAYPDEEVYIDASSYRFSVQAAVNINRNSRYFGYMRNLEDQDYDEYGFVRIAYLLVTAAKMGIHVTVIGQLDGYPISSSAMNFEEYFTYHLNDPCDSNYAKGYVSDYMNFQFCDWTLKGKGGTDMMHTKMCAVSAYLDMNGKAHYNAVWSSSTNFDGVRSTGANGNWKQQTATIVSDHAELYRVCHNYLQLVADYCEQEDIIEWQDLVSTLNTQQIDLLLAGRGNEIPKDEQIVYIGTKNDDVFEMYFTPLGGGTLSWSEIYNPYCKYVRKLYESDDYIEFSWNAAEYSSFYLVRQLESLVSEAFHNNTNVNNKIYVNAENFDSSKYADLTVGKDIGYMSFNSYDFGTIHNKDILMSYSENGQRYFVSLLNSLNMHSGSMYYQSNFVLVIKETSCADNSVYKTVAKYSTLGDLGAHTYGTEQSYLPEKADGYTYHQCTICGYKETTGELHHESSWIIDKEATETANGIRHTECTICGELVKTEEYSYFSELHVDMEQLEGLTFDAGSPLPLGDLKSVPYTLEAIIQVPTDLSGRGGVIVSNYSGGSSAQISLEVYTKGRIRLYAKSGSAKIDCIFSTDIRSDEPVHIAVTVKGTKATLYVGGKAVESKTLSAELPNATRNFMVGGDSRSGNSQYFKGIIYSVSLFSDVRSSTEIKRDTTFVTADAGSLLYSQYYEGVAQYASGTGKTFSASTLNKILTLTGTPKTIEAVIQLPTSVSDRGGVIVSNYGGGSSGQISLEVYTGGRIRLFVNNNGTKSECLFSTDIRSSSAVHVAVTVSGKKATLYINGTATETKTLSVSLPTATENYVIGGDHRSGNKQYFKGTIYSVNLYSDVRTAAEVKRDAMLVATSAPSLLYAKVYGSTTQYEEVVLTGKTFTAGELNRISDLAGNPNTIEALIQVPTSISGRAGVIVSNYDGGNGKQISLEVYSGGRIRLFTKSGSTKIDCIFSTDIRSDKPVHIAVTVKAKKATLYVNGTAVETKTIAANLPKATDNYVIGGDLRSGNSQYFKGTIYSVALFNNWRSASQIYQDMIHVNSSESDLMYSAGCTNYGMMELSGLTFSADQAIAFDQLEGNPNTIEAVIQVPANMSGRGGVIVSNYDGGTGRQISLEVYTKGRIRLFTRSGDKKNDCVFSTDIRSDKPVHIAVTVNGKKATLYVNGTAVETKTLAYNLPKATSNFMVGGDLRSGNSQYFKGTIYSVTLFNDVRSSKEIKRDIRYISSSTADLMYSSYLIQPHTAAGSRACSKHTASQWILDRANSTKLNGTHHTECTVCGQILEIREIRKKADTIVVNYSQMDGLSFSSAKDPLYTIDQTLSKAPLTFEVMLQLDPGYSDRGGVLVSNYDGGEQDQVSLEIYTEGKPRLYFKSGGTGYTCQFSTDIRSESIVHLTVTIDGTTVKLYVDGKLAETKTLKVAVPKLRDGYSIGGDNRSGNKQYFKGTIYSVTLFNDVRTAKEVAVDAIMVASNAKGVLYSMIFE